MGEELPHLAAAAAIPAWGGGAPDRRCGPFWPNGEGCIAAPLAASTETPLLLLLLLFLLCRKPRDYGAAAHKCLSNKR